ncbi:MAG: signal recognition particle protein, partial [Candidatus Aenigmarchaeota archaeon]|nr:signal recognition particle protein [Candidatus Aenigmarchaeota archaeon]
MLGSLSGKLREAMDKLTGKGNIDKAAIDDLTRDIQRALLSADVDVSLVLELSERIRKRASSDLPAALTRKEHVIKVVYEELTDIMGREKATIELKPKKILLCGLFGSGKTSTAAKLARFYQKKGLKPFLICCDTFRPAAYEQLQQLASRIDVPFYGERGEKDSSKVLRNALKRTGGDVIIADSSGRNALDDDMIKEIKNLNEILKSDERILVIPSDIGQAAKEQATAFHNALGISDVIVTKLDATAKGGGALTACSLTGSKVKFIGVGETPEDLQQFDPEKFVARLIGFADLETLLEKARSVVDEKSAKAMLKGDFTMDDFLMQLDSINKMGSMSQILDMAGLGKAVAKKGNVAEQEGKMKKWKFAIQSMTREERNNPEIINSSRMRR